MEPKTIEEAVQSLAKHGKKAKVIAGGTDLLVKMKMGEVNPEVLINISRIPALRYLIEDKGIRIGSLNLLSRAGEISSDQGEIYSPFRGCPIGQFCAD